VIPFKFTGNALHPTQKPVEALRTLIRSFCPPGGTVLDPFCGSGSTAAAAIAENREFLTVEIMREYYDKAKERLEKVQAPPIKHPPALKVVS
ncbi:MAG: DNA methyltransferase, partial [Cyanobacteria bacterium J06642_11]